LGWVGADAEAHEMIFGLGIPEIMVILVVALVVFGPDRLPTVAAQVGRWVRDFRRMTADLTAEFHSVTKEFSNEFEELRAVTQDLQNELRGVQADLANEMRTINQTLLGEEAAPAALPAGGEAQTWAPASPGVVAASEAGWTTSTESQETVMSAAPPLEATKADPRADVSLFDLDDVVVMPRTTRLLNGSHALNGHAEAAVVPPRQSRQPRPPRPTYRRPLSRVG
jgi:Tat protein translocase TatB subunit